MGKRLYVGNLAYSVDSSALQELFGQHGTVTSAYALHNLRGFLDATGWACLYGLNLGQGSRENAAAEAAAAGASKRAGRADGNPGPPSDPGRRGVACPCTPSA